MATLYSSKEDKKYENEDCGDCDENDTATQKSINSARKPYCEEVNVTAGEVSKYETRYYGQKAVYKDKKCLFVWTECNYRMYRNTQIGVATELLQSNEMIKTNVSNYIHWGDDLSSGLKSIVKSMKDLKAKLSDLRGAARKLEDCKNDACNCTQMTLLTGEIPESCKDKVKKPPEDKRPEECKDAKEVLEDLICMPKALGFDADYLLKSSSDLVGIQVFSNISTLELLQKTFSDEAKAFGKLIQDNTKKRESDLKKAQDDLSKAVQEATKSASGLYNKRSDFEGLICTAKSICCPPCDCVVDENCEPRLGDCKDKICKICEEVRETFCECGCEEEEQQESQAR